MQKEKMEENSAYCFALLLSNTNIRADFFYSTERMKLRWNYWSWCVITTMRCDGGKKNTKKMVYFVLLHAVLSNTGARQDRSR